MINFNKITGNVTIETRSNGIDSGLNITTSEFCTYMTKDNIYMITPHDIRLCIEHHKIYETSHLIRGKEIDAYVIPLNFLYNYCIKIYSLTEEYLCQSN